MASDYARRIRVAARRFRDTASQVLPAGLLGCQRARLVRDRLTQLRIWIDEIRRAASHHRILHAGCMKNVPGHLIAHTYGHSPGRQDLGKFQCVGAQCWQLICELGLNAQSKTCCLPINR
eukprot:TRINITY_DN83397_c0_g1_i1.p2 TRINITY_DN83397_c0_g1~~TRINITY_DN83397_c0_g1_i1.p2  ORF type:complete len:120 (-),score=2.84 TRINITY_DN83397_c0_g1_i1:85-444(-)